MADRVLLVGPFFCTSRYFLILSTWILKTSIKGAGGSLSLTSSKMSLHVFVMKGMEGYQMLFTGSKNIVPSLNYRDFKFGFYIQLHCGRAL